MLYDMEVKRIISENDPLFPAAWDIYVENFPLMERRSLQHKCTAMANDRYRFNVYLDGGKVVGIICYWEYDENIYIEHLAIDKSAHGGGYGSKLMRKLIEDNKKVIILEIEPVVDEMTTRRWHFYQRLGFKKNPFVHPLAPYHDDIYSDMNMVILTYPAEISQELYDNFDYQLRNHIMAK